jgi:xylulokinase
LLAVRSRAFRGQTYPADRRRQNLPTGLDLTMAPSKFALGFDLSTQRLKVIALDVMNLETFYEKSLTFEIDLAHYKTVKGVYSNEAEHEVYSPVEMWIEALDVMLDKMKEDQFPFEKVVVISGAGQVSP